MTTIHKIYVNGFWGGFLDKTDANHIGFFESIFPKTASFTNDLDSANVLFESVFAGSLVNAKKWLYKIQYSGEPRSNPINDYDLTLYSEEDTDRILNMPLFVYYIHGNNFLNRLIDRPIRTTVPSRFCCFIVSNGNCGVRNKMFAMLNQYKKVDSCGKFANNMGGILQYDYWTPEFLDFISNYKFIICFENSKFGTYSTEKIVNPYLANIIPIYWSSHHIKKTLNVESMLFLEDEREETYVDLLNRIIELDGDDAKYLEYANRPVFSQMDHWTTNYTIESLSKKLQSNFDMQLHPDLQSNFDIYQSLNPHYNFDTQNESDTQIIFYAQHSFLEKYRMRFFVTHYTPLTNRRKHIIRQLNSASIKECTFILSKDREDLTEEEINKFETISLSERSLFLKHVEVFKIAPENELVVVFEDDAVLRKDFLNCLQSCLSDLENEEWDVLFCGECVNLHGIPEPGKSVCKTDGSRGACMYVLNVGVAKRLYDIFQNQPVVPNQIDWWFNNMEKNTGNKLRYFLSEPTLVLQGSEIGLFSSAIDRT